MLSWDYCSPTKRSDHRCNFVYGSAAAGKLETCELTHG